MISSKVLRTTYYALSSMLLHSVRSSQAALLTLHRPTSGAALLRLGGFATRLPKLKVKAITELQIFTNTPNR